MDRNVEMFMQIEKSLVSNKCWPAPSIHIRPDVDKILVPKLKDIIKRHQGLMVEKEEDATHVVYTLPSHPPPNGSSPIELFPVPASASTRAKYTICNSEKYQFYIVHRTL